MFFVTGKNRMIVKTLFVHRKEYKVLIKKLMTLLQCSVQRETVFAFGSVFNCICV
jgi:hypothetical protein